MATVSAKSLGAEVYRRIARLLAAETRNFNELVKVSGLDPARDFRHADLAGACMEGADLRGFDFSFSDFRNVDLTGASIAGARFERADLAGTDLAKAKGVGEAALDLAILQDAPFTPELVVIPAGSFLMGSPEDEEGRRDNEGPQHRVTFARAFALGRYPVMFQEYDYFCAETDCEQPIDEGWGRGPRPVINVSWNDAQNYCQWLSEATKQRYRLPSEAEWEYACRAGTITRFWTGETISTDYANFGGAPSGGGSGAWGSGPWGSSPWGGSGAYGIGAQGNVRGQTTPVDTFPANPWELHDMHGNVWEWSEDRWKDGYNQAPTDGSAWLHGDSSVLALRGGSWYDRTDDLRSAKRYSAYWEARGNVIGLRIARTVAP